MATKYPIVLAHGIILKDVKFFKAFATAMEVGPSAAPIMAMDAASLFLKKMDAMQRVKKIPN